MSRVVGIETEYGILLKSFSSAQSYPPELSAQTLFKYRRQGYRSTNMFLPSGGRLYLDIGAHPEYASAECRNIDQLLANQEAGETELLNMLKRFNQEDALAVAAKLHILKNNSDSYGNTFGWHENYAIRRDLPLDKLVAVMGTFFATRCFYQGSGDFSGFLDSDYGAAKTVLNADTLYSTSDTPTSTHSHNDSSSDQTAFCLNSEGGLQLGLTGTKVVPFSARARFMQATTSADTTGERALINTRDEPLADKSTWRRLHVTCGDSPVCDISTVVAVSLAVTVIDLLEKHPHAFDHLILPDPLEAFQICARGAFIPLAKGMSALEIQKEFLRIVRSAGGSFPFANGREAEIFNWAERIFQAFENRQVEALVGIVDWATKAKIFTSQITKQLAFSVTTEQKPFKSPQPVFPSSSSPKTAAPETNVINKYKDRLNETDKNKPAGEPANQSAEETQEQVKHLLKRLDLAYHDFSGLYFKVRGNGLITRWQYDLDPQVPPQTTRARLRGEFISRALAKQVDFSVSWQEIRLDSPPTSPVDITDPLQYQSKAVTELIEYLTVHGIRDWIDETSNPYTGRPG